MDKDYLHLIGRVEMLIRMVEEKDPQVLGFRGGQLIKEQFEASLDRLLKKSATPP